MILFPILFYRLRDLDAGDLGLFGGAQPMGDFTIRMGKERELRIILLAEES